MLWIEDEDEKKETFHNPNHIRDSLLCYAALIAWTAIFTLIGKAIGL
jgi:hypothetical protein